MAGNALAVEAFDGARGHSDIEGAGWPGGASAGAARGWRSVRRPPIADNRLVANAIP